MRIAPGGLRLAAVPTILALPGFFVSPLVSVALLGIAAGVLAFYRDPERTPPSSDVVAPADGTVTVLREEDGRIRLGVFMNVTDVHVNRAPLPATVVDTTHKPGRHRPAFSKDSDRNERVIIDCDDHEVTLIAGAFARRIRTYVTAGSTVDRGDRIGHIAFGSRADILLPQSIDRSDLQVSVGDSVRAGETIVAITPE